MRVPYEVAADLRSPRRSPSGTPRAGGDGDDGPGSSTPLAPGRPLRHLADDQPPPLGRREAQGERSAGARHRSQAPRPATPGPSQKNSYAATSAGLTASIAP